MIKFDEVVVLGVPFQVVVKPQIEIAQDLNIKEGLGYCDDVDDVIAIADELKGKPQVRVFIHEWAHAVCSANGLNQTLESVVAESISQSFGNALIEMLSQKKVRDYLIKSIPAK
jgi:hypothetical protein